MAVNASVYQEEESSASKGFQPARGSGWLAGYKNMLGKELGDWFHTRRWIVQSLIWLVLLDGMLILILFVIPSVDPTSVEATGAPADKFISGIGLFFSLAVQIGAMGMIILTQDEVIQEKQSGTAAWILSKPVSRYAFLLSKMISNLIGGLIFIVGLPALVAYALIFFATGHAAPALPYALAIGVVLLVLVFYITLVILLGSVFDQRGPVLGISFGLMFISLIVAGSVPQVAYFLPVGMQNIAQVVVQMQPLPTVAVSELVFTAGWILVFSLVALSRFQREEF